MPVEANAAVWRVGGREVRVTHLSKRFWPATGVTKGDVLWYYHAVVPTLLPYLHLRDRLVTMRVFPEGASGSSLYRRDPPEHAPEWLRRTTYHTMSHHTLVVWATALFATPQALARGFYNGMMRRGITPKRPSGPH